MKYKTYGLRRDRVQGNLAQPRPVMKEIGLSPARTEAQGEALSRQARTELSSQLLKQPKLFPAPRKQLNKSADAYVVQGEGEAHAKLAATLGSAIPMILFVEA